MSVSLSALSCIWLAASPASDQELAVQPWPRVVLSSPNEEYVLGEPVLLTVNVTNVSKNNIEAWEIFVEGCEPEIRISISRDGVGFEPCQIGILPTVYREREIKILRPRKSWRYDLRLVYRREASNKLAFGEPGQYWVKARYPLMLGEFRPVKREDIDSNVLKIHVNEPKEIDATVWQKIRSPEYVHFLQVGWPPHGEDHVPMKVLKLLRTISTSSYHPALRDGLEKYYHHRRFQVHAEYRAELRQLETIRSFLGISKDQAGLFADDRRLDIEITYHFPKPTLLEDVFKQISRQSGVTLEVAPELQEIRVSSLKRTRPLRAFMASRTEYYARWIRSGDGYRLVLATQRE